MIEAKLARQLPIQAEAEQIHPTADQLLVRIEPEDTEHHGILIPETARRPGNRGGDKHLKFGVVVAVGPGDRCRCTATLPAKPAYKWGSYPAWDCRRCFGTGLLPIHVKPGDRILYDHPSDRQYLVSGELHVILHEEQHVLAVLG